MASIVFAQNLLSTVRKLKAQDSIEYLRRRDGGSKARKILFEEENSIQNIAAAVVCSSTKEQKGKGPVEQRDCLWWQHGYHNGTNEQFKRRLRVNRDTFDFILNAVEDPNFVSFCLLRSGLRLLVPLCAIKSCWLSSSTLFVRRKCKKVVLIFASNVNLRQFSVSDEFPVLFSRRFRWKNRLINLRRNTRS